MSNGGTLIPQEILTDVLSRLPVKSLFRFKCVSSSWKTLISDPYFAKAHLNRTNTNNPKQFGHNIILLSRTRTSTSTSTSQDLYSVNLTADVPLATKLYLPSLPQPQIKTGGMGSCNGLLLFADKINGGYVLLNPSTRECKKLPPLPFVLNPVRGHFRCYPYGVGYDSSRDEYKVVMISYHICVFESESNSDAESSTPKDTTIVAVYSLKTNSWRRIQDTHYRLMSPGFGVYFNGCLHWHCSRAGSNLMVAFDLADEIFREVPLPALLFDDDLVQEAEVVIVGDCLCLFYVPSSSKIEVWTMKEYGVAASWTKIIIDIHDMNLRLWGRVLLGLLAEDEFVLSTMREIISRDTNNQLVVYNPKKGTLRDILICGTPTDFAVMGTYVESLVSPNQCYHGGGIGKQG